ncbi:MAG: hypothetical protein K0Q92_2986 [Steroidobacteraceae bacterium]|jgi:hypothetical protein|nr:hypothetical protein [Steroidobacteraceae bacterium]
MTSRYAPAIARISPAADIDEMRRALTALQEHTLTREPEEDGDPLDKTITWRDAVANGLAEYTLTPPGGGIPGSFEPPPRGGLSGWDDLTPPEPLDNLVVTSIPTGFFVEFDAPTYRQGGGNAYSIIYQANYSGAGPLPTFGDAVQVGTVTERNVILVIAAEPGVQGHFWAQPVSHAEDYNQIAPQTPASGGTNGVSAVAGQLSNDHIADLSAGKITAGAIAVGEFIESTGYDPGVYGWRIDGDGEVDFRGGTIGGIVIDADSLESDNYVANTSGFRFDNATGNLYANAIFLHPNDYTKNSHDTTTSISETWPAATNPWNAFPDTYGDWVQDVTHVYNRGILTTYSDVQLVATFGSASGVVAAKVRVKLLRRSPTPAVGVIREAVVYAKTVLVGSSLIATFNVSLGAQSDRDEILSGSYHFGLGIDDCYTYDAAGAAVSAGASATLTGTAFVQVVETQI